MRENAAARDINIDIASTRTESYLSPGALPKIDLIGVSIVDDLRRRDFSINALAISLQAYCDGSWDQIIDPVNGRESLKTLKLEVLHNQSFVDDPTRILRAAKYKNRFGLSIGKTTLDLLQKAVSSNVISTFSGRRFMHEMMLISNELGRDSFDTLIEWGVIAHSSTYNRNRIIGLRNIDDLSNDPFRQSARLMWLYDFDVELSVGHLELDTLNENFINNVQAMSVIVGVFFENYLVRCWRYINIFNILRLKLFSVSLKCFNANLHFIRRLTSTVKLLVWSKKLQPENIYCNKDCTTVQK